MRLEWAERVADAILYEGYLLYPYRASAAKNQLRWQFGVVAPRPPREEDGEPWFTHTECLVEPLGDLRLSIRVRFLQPRLADSENACARRSATGDGGWLEGVPHAIDLDSVELANLPMTRDVELATRGLAARVCIEAAPIDAFVKLRIRLENLQPWRAEFAINRDEMLRQSLVAAHLLLAIDGGAFVSLLEPPEAVASIAASCTNRHTWPVLVGDRGRRDLMLSSPIVLYDYPAVAKESVGDLCDAAEIDEILSLRIMTLTDEEKREARETDPRARSIINRVDGLTPEAFARLHGTMRSADFFNPPGTPSPDEAFVTVGDARMQKGARVRLRPTRRADAMDMFLRDQAATVAGVYRDVDDRVYVAVTVDADPAATLHESFGRFFYFDPTELDPIASEEEHA
jgi:hypothetical protein